MISCSATDALAIFRDGHIEPSIKGNHCIVRQSIKGSVGVGHVDAVRRHVPIPRANSAGGLRSREASVNYAQARFAVSRSTQKLVLFGDVLINADHSNSPTSVVSD